MPQKAFSKSRARPTASPHTYNTEYQYQNTFASNQLFKKCPNVQLFLLSKKSSPSQFSPSRLFRNSLGLSKIVSTITREVRWRTESYFIVISGHRLLEDAKQRGVPFPTAIAHNLLDIRSGFRFRYVTSRPNPTSAPKSLHSNLNCLIFSNQGLQSFHQIPVHFAQRLFLRYSPWYLL